MAETSRTALKAFFETGDAPSQAQFGDLIDSFLNFVSDFKFCFGTISQAGVAAPTLDIKFNNLGFTPTTSYVGVGEYSIDSTGNFDSTKTVQFIGSAFVFGNWSQITLGDGIDSLTVFSGSDPSTQANGILTDVSFLIIKIP